MFFIFLCKFQNMYAQYVLFNKEVLLKGYNFEQKGLRSCCQTCKSGDLRNIKNLSSKRAIREHCWLDTIISQLVKTILRCLHWPKIIWISVYGTKTRRVYRYSHSSSGRPGLCAEDRIIFETLQAKNQAELIQRLSWHIQYMA